MHLTLICISQNLLVDCMPFITFFKAFYIIWFLLGLVPLSLENLHRRRIGPTQNLFLMLKLMTPQIQQGGMEKFMHTVGGFLGRTWLAPNLVWKWFERAGKEDRVGSGVEFLCLGPGLCGLNLHQRRQHLDYITLLRCGARRIRRNVGLESY